MCFDIGLSSMDGLRRRGKGQVIVRQEPLSRNIGGSVQLVTCSNTCSVACAALFTLGYAFNGAPQLFNSTLRGDPEGVEMARIQTHMACAA